MTGEGHLATDGGSNWGRGEPWAGSWCSEDGPPPGFADGQDAEKRETEREEEESCWDQDGQTREKQV